MRFKLAAEPFVCMCVRVWISVGEGGGRGGKGGVGKGGTSSLEY